MYMAVCIPEYDTMDIPMLNEVIQMLRQQLEKAQVDRNYVQHERVRLMLTGVMSSIARYIKEC